jgi:AraC-like DNA-binding protein
MLTAQQRVRTVSRPDEKGLRAKRWLKNGRDVPASSARVRRVGGEEMAADAAPGFDRSEWARQSDRRADGTFARQNFAGRRDAQSREERRQAVARLLPILHSCRRVARELGVNEETVRADAIFLGLERLQAACAPENRRSSAERAMQAKKLYESGLNMERVAHELEISERQVSRYLHRLGVTIRPAGMPPKYPPVESHTCPGCGLTFEPPKPAYVAAGKYESCCTSCGQKVRFNKRGLMPAEFIHPTWSANKRRKWGGKRAARKAPSGAGKRPRGRPPAIIDAAEFAYVLRLRREHPDWGERSIARGAKLSRYLVRRIIAEAECDAASDDALAA